nr:MAG TPA: hypothetical protein [Caudoviricetes sp.]
MPQGAGAVKRIKVAMTRWNGERITLRIGRRFNVYDFKRRYVVDSRWINAGEDIRNRQTLYESSSFEATAARLNGMVKSLIISGFDIKRATRGFYETAEDD